MRLHSRKEPFALRCTATTEHLKGYKQAKIVVFRMTSASNRMVAVGGSCAMVCSGHHLVAV